MINNLIEIISQTFKLQVVDPWGFVDTSLRTTALDLGATFLFFLSSFARVNIKFVKNVPGWCETVTAD